MAGKKGKVIALGSLREGGGGKGGKNKWGWGKKKGAPAFWKKGNPPKVL